jgi:hypothetical protein
LEKCVSVPPDYVQDIRRVGTTGGRWVNVRWDLLQNLWSRIEFSANLIIPHSCGIPVW